MQLLKKSLTVGTAIAISVTCFEAKGKDEEPQFSPEDLAKIEKALGNVSEKIEKLEKLEKLGNPEVEMGKDFGGFEGVAAAALQMAETFFQLAEIAEQEILSIPEAERTASQKAELADFQKQKSEMRKEIDQLKKEIAKP